MSIRQLQEIEAARWQSISEKDVYGQEFVHVERAPGCGPALFTVIALINPFANKAYVPSNGGRWIVHPKPGYMFSTEKPEIIKAI